MDEAAQVSYDVSNFKFHSKILIYPQVLQTAALAPLFFSDRFILVGDALQLPPVVKSQTAK